MASLSSPGSLPTAADARPRTTSALSYSSNRSRRSSGSGPKLDLTESHSEKKRLHTKANPNVATNELQPSAVAQQEGTLDDLRSMPHKDRFGNIIADPDRSNPTRPRMERPLDTIRSFQEAAEGTSSNRRSTYVRSNSQMSFNGMDTRRSSYYGAPNPQSPSNRPRPQAGGYYRNSSYGFRPDSFVEEGPGAAEQWTNRGGQMRNPPTPMYYGNGNGQPSPAHSHQQSYETMTSGSDENGKSTNPSSQNSSFDQLQQLRQKDDYGYDGQNGYNGNYSSVSPARQYGPGSYNQNGVNDAHSANGMNGMNGMRQPMPPLPPAKEYVPNNPRVPIKLDSSQGRSQFEEDFKRSDSNANKRQSWFKRKFNR